MLFSVLYQYSSNSEIIVRANTAGHLVIRKSFLKTVDEYSTPINIIKDWKWRCIFGNTEIHPCFQLVFKVHLPLFL